MLHLDKRLTLLAALALGVSLHTPGYAKDPPSNVPRPPAMGPGGVPTPPTLTPPPAVEPDDDADREGRGSSDSSSDRSGSEGTRAGGTLPKSGGSSGSSSSSSPTGERQRPPQLSGYGTKVTIDFVDTQLTDLIKYMAEITGRNFILQDDIKGSITIISHKPVSVSAAYEAFLSALEVEGYTTVTVGGITKIVSSSDAGNTPLRVYEGSNIPYTDNFVTQIIQLENVSVSDISSVVKDLLGKQGRVIAYAPTNTLIITDAATNIRKVYRIISQLDVEAPKSKMVIIPIQHAQAADIETILEELFGSEESSSGDTSSSSARERARERRRRRRTRETDPAGSEASATKVGSEGKYIEKIISDERTNSLIVLANETALKSIVEIVAQLDVDVDPASRAQIHVVYLEHAKAEEVATVLANLSESGSTSSSSSRRQSGSGKSGQRGGRQSGRGGPPRPDDIGGPDSADGSAIAAFDSGVRITSDENTNSLVIIATPDQFRIIKQVIDMLDIRRKQVFVEAVILELASDDEFEFGMGVHMGKPSDDGGMTIALAQMGGSSLGLSADLLSGMAMGVFGEPVEVSIAGEDGSSTLSVPAFGIAFDALQSNSSVDILSTPNVLTMDNEEAEIIVGRNIPFPVSTGRDNNNNPIVSYQREDVAIKLKVTPQINESNFVTLEVFQEVTEVEEDSGALDVSTAGFITSKRSAETTVVVKDNQTVVIGGLIGHTDTEVETKVPILGDLPLLGALFRGTRKKSRKTNLLIFLTPHVISEPADLEEVYRVKVAQREEFIKRFYGKSRDKQEEQLAGLLRYSMNLIDEPSPYRQKPPPAKTETPIGSTEPTAPTAPTTIHIGEGEDTELPDNIEIIDDPTEGP